MKLVKLYAYLQNNVGDDLMVELLVERYPNCYFWGCRGYQKKTKKLQNTGHFFDNEDVYARFGRLNHLCNFITNNKSLVYEKAFSRLNKKCICGVTIGGSIFKEIDDQPLEERLAYEEKKKAPEVPYFVIGANFGPYHSLEFHNLFYNYFSTCTGVSFRDQQSYELFRELQHVQWAPDIVFNVPEGEIVDGNRIIISVINLDMRESIQQFKTLYIEKMVSLCMFWADKGKIPVLTSFCSFEGDKECVDSIYNILTDDYKEKTERYYYNGDTEEVLELFRNAHFVIATRFHAMILAMRFHKPLFTISYELKMDNILKETDSTAFSKISELANYSPEMIFQMGKNPVVIDDYILCAEKQFKQLDEYFKE